MKPTILAIEDDKQIRSLYKTLFETAGYPYQVCANGRQALMEIMRKPPDIILLDLGLPDMDGVTMIEKIRSFCSVPIVVVSARSMDADKIEALDKGADDYLSKPFSVDELLARLRVIERRMAQNTTVSTPSTRFENGGLVIDYQGRTAWLDGQKLHLTPMEYKLLDLFSRNVDKVLTRQFITNKIWGVGYEEDNRSLRVYMTTLRKKLNRRFIETCFGVGYKMVQEESTD